MTEDTPYLLDTNVLLVLLRGGLPGATLDERFGLSRAALRPLVCIVTHGEIRSLARRNGWGPRRLAALEHALAGVVTVELGHPGVIDAYVALDLASQSHPDGARNMGKNDLWIAAAAKAAGAMLLTTDKDFEHLLGIHVDGVLIDPSSLASAHD